MKNKTLKTLFKWQMRIKAAQHYVYAQYGNVIFIWYLLEI